MRYVLLLVLFFVTSTISAQAQDEANYFVESEISDLNPFVGQQIIYTFRVYSKVSRTQQGNIVAPDFDGFWNQPVGPVRRYTTFVDNESYDVTERLIALFPSYVGEIRIGPSALLIPRNPSRVAEVLLTDPLVVNVRALPLEQDSDNFDGVVGQLEIEPTVDRQEVSLGEPLTMRLTIRGNGNIEQLSSPSLPQGDIWGVLSNPSNYQATELQGMLIGQKTFEWLLTAREPGLHALPEITLTYFEPSTQSYRSIRTTAVMVNVLPAAEGAIAPDVVFATIDPLPLKPIPASLSVGAQQTGIWVWVVWLLPPLVTFIAWWQVRRRLRREQNADYYRQSEALKRALGTLRKARQSSEPYRIIRTALLTYFADKLNLPPSTLSYVDIENAMRQKDLDSESASAFVTYLQQIDRVLYAPGDSLQNPEMIQYAAKMLESLDVRWKAT